MRLKPGVTIELAETVLLNAEIAWTNARGGSFGYYRAYTDAVDNTYPQLKQTFASPDLAAGIYSPTFWHLVELGDPRQNPGLTTDSTIAAAYQSGTRTTNQLFSREIDEQIAILTRA